jgi:hypothetical protein
MGDLWALVVMAREPTPAQSACFPTAPNHVIGTYADDVQLVFIAAGGMAVYQKAPLDRCLRDILTMNMNQYLWATLRTRENGGTPGAGFAGSRVAAVAHLAG